MYGKRKRTLARTEKLRDQLLARLTNKASDGTIGATTDFGAATMLAPIESQLQSNQLEISNRDHAITALKAKVDDYQARLNQEPIREQQLADQTRGHDESKLNYDSLLKKKNESSMATSMEQPLQQGERFRVVDPPSLPRSPNFRTA